MESKKINQLATELAPDLSDITIIGDPTTGISKKITLSQMASLFTGTVEEYANLAAFPLVGVADTIYIALDTNIIYRYDTSLSAYVILSPNIINSLVFSDANGFDGTITLVGSVATLSITTALTSGSVPFIGASGALSQDNANLFFDDTNNRLGINTNAPTTALDVFGSGIIGRINGTSTNNAYLGFASAGTNKWSIGNVQSDHRFRIYNEATTSELVSVLSTGEFGIGIANPTTKFHIDGAASALIANLDANVSIAKSVSYRSDNSARINLEVSGTESGSNAGADFFLRTFTDAGSLLETPFTIVRSTGVTTIKSLTLTNVLSVANGGTGSATQNFVDLTTTQSIGGAKTLTSALAGTSASFSSTATATAFIPSGATIPTNGMYLSAANTLNFATNTTNKLTISSTGNLLLGNDSSPYFEIANSGATNTLSGIRWVSGSGRTDSGGIEMASPSSNSSYLIFKTRNSGSTAERFRISELGNFGFGTGDIVSSNLTGSLTVRKSYSGDTPNGATTQDYYLNQSGLYLFGRNSGLTIVTNNNEEGEIIFANNSTRRYATIATGAGTSSVGGDMYFKVGSNGEKVRITSTGYLKASNNGSYSTGSTHELVNSVGGNYAAQFSNTHPTSPFGIQIYYPNTLNNTSNRFIDCEDNTALRFSARSNGGLANFQANDVNLSDKFKAIEIVKFKYKDQTHDDFNIGVIAQQVEKIAPEFIDIDGWDTKPKLDEEGNEIISTEEPLKSVYTSDLHHATIKVLQEAMTKIEALEEKVKQLESK